MGTGRLAPNTPISTAEVTSGRFERVTSVVFDIKTIIRGDLEGHTLKQRKMQLRKNTSAQRYLIT